MAIIKLGNRPKTFKEIPVAITLPDGSEGVIPVTFKYMDKMQFGKWQDGAASGFKDMKADNDDFSWEKFYKATGESSAEKLLEVIDSWGLDVELSKQAIIEIEIDCGAAALPALFAAFGLACREGRLGN